MRCRRPPGMLGWPQELLGSRAGAWRVRPAPGYLSRGSLYPASPLAKLRPSSSATCRGRGLPEVPAQSGAGAGGRAAAIAMCGRGPELACSARGVSETGGTPAGSAGGGQVAAPGQSRSAGPGLPTSPRVKAAAELPHRGPERATGGGGFSLSRSCRRRLSRRLAKRSIHDKAAATSPAAPAALTLETVMQKVLSAKRAGKRGSFLRAPSSARRNGRAALPCGGIGVRG